MGLKLLQALLKIRTLAALPSLERFKPILRFVLPLGAVGIILFQHRAIKNMKRDYQALQISCEAIRKERPNVITVTRTVKVAGPERVIRRVIFVDNPSGVSEITTIKEKAGEKQENDSWSGYSYGSESLKKADFQWFAGISGLWGPNMRQSAFFGYQINPRIALLAGPVVDFKNSQYGGQVGLLVRF